MHAEVSGKAIEVQLVHVGRRDLVVFDKFQIPAGTGYALRRTYATGSQLVVELAKSDCGCERIRTLYVDLVAELWHEVRHTEGSRRARRRVRNIS